MAKRRNTRATNTTGAPNESGGRRDYVRVSMLMHREVRKMLGQLALEQERELYQVAEDACRAHVNRFALFRRRDPAPSPALASPADDVAGEDSATAA